MENFDIKLTKLDEKRLGKLFLVSPDEPDFKSH